MSQSPTALFRPASEWPVAGEYDVAIAGAGPGGFGAAIAAARMGARTVLVDQAATPGGMATNAMIPHLMGIAIGGQTICSGIIEELASRLGKLGYGYLRAAGRKPADQPFVGQPLTADMITCVHGLHVAMLQMLAEAGVETRFYTRILGACADASARRLTAIAVDAAEGMGLIRAKTFIDATGDAHLTWRAGGATREGAADEVMTKTLLMDVGGVTEFEAEAVQNAFAAQVKAGTVPVAIQDRFMGYRTFEPGVVQLNFSATTGNALDAKELTRIDRELREQIEAGVAWFRKYIPGFASCHLLRTPNVVGIRAGRSAVGKETIVQADIDADSPVAEPVAIGIRRYGDHGTKSFSAGWGKPVSGWRSIPWRTLLQQDFDNLALAGRAISCETKMITCIRYIAQCVSTGQAAGANAALARHTGGDLLAVGYPKLREALLAQHALLELPAAATAKP